MSKIEMFLSVVLALGMASCAEVESAIPEEMKTKVFRASYGKDTRAVMVAGNNIQWSGGEPVQFYLANSATSCSGVASTSAVGSGESTQIGFDYTGSWAKCLFIFKGTAVGAISAADLSTVTISGAVPANQDGTFEPCQISKAVGDMNGDDEVTFKHLQTYISFSVVDKTISGKDIKTITVEGLKSGDKIAGDMQFNMSTDGNVIPSSGSNLITVSPTGGVQIGRTYYVAVRPAEYTSGIRLVLKDGSGTNIAYADTKSFTPEFGKINDMGNLDSHWTVPGTACTMLPTVAYLCNKNDMKMTKKLWAYFEPSDVTGVTWSANPSSAVESFTKGADETLSDGKTYKTVVVKLASSKTSGDVVITATLDGVAAVKAVKSAVCTLKVGDFVDLGIKDGTKRLLWARSNVTGTYSATAASNTLALATNTEDKGGYYMWGATFPCTLTKWDVSQYNMWSGTWETTNYGGRYNNTTDKVAELRTEDDVAYRCGVKVESATTWRMPSKAQADALKSNTNLITIFYSSGNAMARFQSKVLGYTDMYIDLRLAGSMWDGDYRHDVAVGTYRTSTLITGTDTQVLYNITLSAFNSAWLLTCGDNPASGHCSYQRYGGMPVRPIKLVD